MFGESGRCEVVGDAGLPDPRLARDQHDPTVAVHLHASPRGTEPPQLSPAPHESRLELPGEDGGRRDGRRFAATEILDQRACLARRRDPELRAQSLDELSSGGERCAAIAAGRDALDQPAIGRLRQRVQRHLRPGQADRVARVLGCSRRLLQRLAKAL